MIQDPPRTVAPHDPGPIGGASGHLGRVRAGGALLLLAVGVRLLGTVALVALNPHVALGNTALMLVSSVFFVLAGAVSLSRPGWRVWPRGWGLLALGGLLAAEAAGVLGLLLAADRHMVTGEYLMRLITQPVASPDFDVTAGYLLLSAHPALMAVAAGGLLGHVRALLRPGAATRRLAAVLLGAVVSLLVGWSILGGVAMVTQAEVAAVLTFLVMALLPPLAAGTALLMMAQRGLSRDQAVEAIAGGLADAGHTASPARMLPDGAWVEGRGGGLVVRVRLDDARLPLACTVSVALPPGLETLRITQRAPRSRAPRIGDMVLDPLVEVEGMPPEEAARRLGAAHSELLAVLHGHPGSGVCDGAIHLRAAIGAGLRIVPGSTRRQRDALQAMVSQSVREVLDLRAVLTGATETPRQGSEAARAAAASRLPEPGR